MPRFPIEYEVSVRENNGQPAELHSGRRPVIHVGPPPEFGGNEMLWSPEHLFASAIASCFVSTFLAMTRRASLHIGSIRCDARTTLGRTPEARDGQRVRFTEAHLAVTVRTLEDDIPRAKEIFEDAKQHCFVANSVVCPVHATLAITAT